MFLGWLWVCVCVCVWRLAVWVYLCFLFGLVFGNFWSVAGISLYPIFGSHEPKGNACISVSGFQFFFVRFLLRCSLDTRWSLPRFRLANERLYFAFRFLDNLNGTLICTKYVSFSFVLFVFASSHRYFSSSIPFVVHRTATKEPTSRLFPLHKHRTNVQHNNNIRKEKKGRRNG